jgi:hypothetical protein
MMEKANVVNAAALVGAEALRKYEAGVRVVCPVCSSELQAIPAGARPGQQISGLICPTDQRHYLLYGEDEAAMKGMRAFMKELASKRK